MKYTEYMTRLDNLVGNTNKINELQIGVENLNEVQEEAMDLLNEVDFLYGRIAQFSALASTTNAVHAKKLLNKCRNTLKAVMSQCEKLEVYYYTY